jgi:hypothetical protein
MSWESAPMLQTVMIQSVSHSRAPIFFFQAQNDFDLAPSKTLSAAMKKAGLSYEVKFYPSFGKSTRDGHSFAYLGSAVWVGDVFAFLDKHCRK